ncbi:unnamed protein product [Onchocerca flexuosa]|uniref:C2H2-type domain-containing protein n=1 Tax=Onchocerca flexuosa TaxID=387005 RepID=A0A183HEE0_9BILA|nr:unnamed protein product [Onchocerca flexuosa]
MIYKLMMNEIIEISASEIRSIFKVCLRTFADRKAMEQHESYHKRVHLLIEHGDLEIVDPEILLPETCDIMDEEVEAV